jgi:TPR repeat protein
MNRKILHPQPLPSAPPAYDKIDESIPQTKPEKKSDSKTWVKAFKIMTHLSPASMTSILTEVEQFIKSAPKSLVIRKGGILENLHAWYPKGRPDVKANLNRISEDYLENKNRFDLDRTKPEECARLGYMYGTGTGISENRMKAKEWLMSGTRQKNTFCAFKLAVGDMGQNNGKAYYSLIEAEKLGCKLAGPTREAMTQLRNKGTPWSNARLREMKSVLENLDSDHPASLRQAAKNLPNHYVFSNLRKNLSLIATEKGHIP